MAKRFQFRLERLKQLRERKREQRQIAHAEAVASQMRMETQLTTIGSLRTAEQEGLRASLSTTSIDVDHVIRSRTYDTHLIRQGLQLLQHLHQVKRVVEARRVELVHADREVRILDKLEEKQSGRYHAALELEESKALDEIGLRIANRRPESGASALDTRA